ncbi:MAG: TspO/MBR family protein [Eubacteriales bacterium]|nr:TspO/MBR family protein [Eubacteriales bacterium]
MRTLGIRTTFSTGMAIFVLVIAVLIPLAVGGASSVITRSAMTQYNSFNKPALSPPGWLFPVAWTILYILMGLASGIVFLSDCDPDVKRTALIIYVVQLVFNFFWSIFFFNMSLYLFSFIWLLAMWMMVIACTVLFWIANRAAGMMMLPYIAWSTFAAYLNLAVYLMSRKPMPL